MPKPSHIFIVGLYRSGTTLMRNILNSSGDIALCGETHFLGESVNRGGLRKQLAEIGDIANEADAQKVVDLLYSRRKSFFGTWMRKNVSREEFLLKLVETERTDRAVFDLVMILYANGRSIRGEKTPAHIHYVPTLLEWFPQAKIIHTFRDPRAIFVSEYHKKLKQRNPSRRYRVLRRSKLALGFYLSFHVLISWLSVIRLHRRYQKLYPDSYYFVKYEDLITDPGTRLKDICAFLDIDFTEAMLQQMVINSSFVPRDKQTQGFDTSAINRWKQYLHPVVNKWFVLCCRQQLMEFGYET